MRSYGLSSIKACISGAAPLPVEVQEAFEKLTRGRLVEGYGLTEASPVTHANPLEGARKPAPSAFPSPTPTPRSWICGPGRRCPPARSANWWSRGRRSCKGTWNPSDLGPEDSVLQDGWLYTGDVAVMDADGFTQIISRKRDTILAGEYSVYPRDVEEVLYENSKVLEVAVVGVSTGSGGQKVKAFVVPRPGIGPFRAGTAGPLPATPGRVCRPLGDRIPRRAAQILCRQGPAPVADRGPMTSRSWGPPGV